MIKTKKALEKRLSKLIDGEYSRFHGKMTKAVNEYIENCKEPDNYNQFTYGYGTLDRKLDDLVFLRGWIEDRMNHRNLKDKKAMTRKLHHLLGYNSYGL